MVRIILSNLAKKDLKEIVEYIKRDSARYALLEKERIKNAIDKLYDQPELGRVFPKFNDENFRELIHSHYSIIYQISVDLKQITILTIHHHSRSLKKNTALNEDE